LAGSSVPGTGFFRDVRESPKVAPKERATHGLHQGQPFAWLVISFQLLSYFHAIKSS
jgi:hypothetical protein